MFKQTIICGVEDRRTVIEIFFIDGMGKRAQVERLLVWMGNRRRKNKRRREQVKRKRIVVGLNEMKKQQY